MKKNSGSALTSVIVVFFLVTIIGVPLLGMVVYNYQLREYDSGIKEAEYRNEVVMDRVAVIIKNEVIAAISEAKNTSTDDIRLITEALVSSYNNAYDSAVDTVAQYDGEGNIINEETIKGQLEENLKAGLSEYQDVTKEEIVGILDLDASNNDLSNAKINDEILIAVCNNMFQKRYHDILLDRNNGLFEAIYNKLKYDDLGILEENMKYGTEQMNVDTGTGKTLATSLRVASHYDYDETRGEFIETYENDGLKFHDAAFDLATGKIEIGIESKYKLNPRVPVTTLSATFIIDTPDFNAISAIEQQTIALSNPTLDYGLIVGETLKLNGDTNIDGNILVRANGVRTEGSGDSKKVYDDGIVMASGSSLKSIKKDVDGTAMVSNGRIATPGDIIMNVNTTLETGTNPIYYRNLYLGDPNNQQNSGRIDVTFNGDVLAKDDLEINLNSTVNVTQTAGSYFGYNDLNDDGPDSSSAIVVNSGAINGIKITLKNLYLAGRAFIDGVKSTTMVDKHGNPMIYKTGESISVKGNYIAYQTPIINSEDYDGDGISGDYDVNNVKFSPHFMTSRKDGIEEDTNLTINLVDNFIQEKKYEDFDFENKWQYFKAYASKNPINKLNVDIESVKYITGVGINNGTIVDKFENPNESPVLKAKSNSFEEFTKYFGYAPKDESLKKEKISDWIKFGDIKKEVQDNNFYTYISKKNAGKQTLAWGVSPTGADINIPLNNKDGINGIIIYDGDLTITSACDSEIPFNGIIIVTGNLVIEGDITINSDKDTVAKIVIENYLGNNYTYNTGTPSTSLIEGDLFNVFTYDGSGTVYVAVDITDRSNLIDINDLVGITDWKKQSYGRL